MRFGLITFSETGQIVFNLNQYSTRTELVDAINAISIVGPGTDIAAGLDAVETVLLPSNGGREEVSDLVVVITYDTSDRRPGELAYAATQLRQAGCRH